LLEARYDIFGGVQDGDRSVVTFAKAIITGQKVSASSCLGTGTMQGIERTYAERLKDQSALLDGRAQGNMMYGQTEALPYPEAS
jgi:hypothetical protein